MNQKAKIGDSIKIVEMIGEPKYSSREGVVVFVDDIGQLFGSWGSLAINPEIDKYEIIEFSKENDVEN